VYNEKRPDDGQMNCPKRVEFYSKNKFEKLVHLVGFITRIILEFCVLYVCVSSYCPTLCTYLYILMFTWKVWCKEFCVGEGTRNVVMCA